MRGNWLATVYRLNWPPDYAVITSSADEENIKKQKDAMITMLDGFVEGNQNIVFFQVRSRCDAMYKSSYEPWSSDLVATRGMDPGYDPLQFVIEEGHKRGLEIHAWVNPYRFESTAGQWKGMSGDYATTNPDWIIQVGNATILNPGKPEVRERITAVIEEIVRNYDVDGVVFDDYFYLQGITNQDIKEQQLYNTDGLSVGDWRRANVNKMVAGVSEMIQRVKPYVRFGVSPAGIWGGSSDAIFKYDVMSPQGIGSGYAYNGIYCDPLAWLFEGTVDYISPQIYWTVGSGSTDYAVLAEWWSNIGRKFNRHFYSSHSISSLDPWNTPIPPTIQIGNNIISKEGLSRIEYAISEEIDTQPLRAPSSFGYSEVGRQIDCNRLYDKNDAPGSIFYSAKKFLQTKGFIPYLLENQFKYKSLMPAIFWKSEGVLEMVNHLALTDDKLSWQCDKSNMRFAVYAIPVNEPLKRLDEAEFLCGITYTNEFKLPAGISAASHWIGVSMLDRYANESPVAILNKTATQLGKSDLLIPENNAMLILPAEFSWKALADATGYRIEIADNAAFSSLKAMRITNTPSISTNDLFPLDLEKEYYWRIITMAPGEIPGISEVRKFNLFAFNIISPINNATDVNLTPEIKWVEWLSADSYLIEISTSQAFGNSIIFSQNLKETSFLIPEEVLKSSTLYYVRVTATGEGASLQTPIVSFKTAELIPDVPVILSPVHESSVATGKISVIIQKNPNASGFRYELSQSESFPPRSTNITSTDAFIYKLDYELEAGTYYSRVRAAYGTNNTAWSNVVKFTVETTDGITTITNHGKIYINTDGSTHYLHLPINVGVGSVIQIFTNDGKLMNTQIIPTKIGSGNFQQIDLKTNSLDKGVYILVIRQGSYCQVEKFFK